MAKQDFFPVGRLAEQHGPSNKRAGFASLETEAGRGAEANHSKKITVNVRGIKTYQVQKA